MNKNSLIFVLISLLVASLIFGGYFFLQPRKENETVITQIKVKYVHEFEIKSTVNALLAQGVATAWEDNFTPKIKADCFSTEVLPDGFSIFSYCKLRKHLLIENQ